MHWMQKRWRHGSTHDSIMRLKHMQQSVSASFFSSLSNYSINFLTWPDTSWNCFSSVFLFMILALSAISFFSAFYFSSIIFLYLLVGIALGLPSLSKNTILKLVQSLAFTPYAFQSFDNYYLITSAKCKNVLCSSSPFTSMVFLT